MSKPLWIGKSVARKEDDRLLRGLGQFVDDVEAAAFARRTRRARRAPASYRGDFA